MNTKVFKMTTEHIDGEIIAQCGQVIRDGGLVAFPTETVYGLGANALSEDAAMKVYEAKGRPSDNPLIAHICNVDMLKDLTSDISDSAKKLMDAFWPGPMTLIFKKSDKVPKGTTGGLDTIAVRYPDHKIALALIESAGVSVAAPSANLSGKPSPTLGEHVIDDMEGRIDVIIDGGAVGIGVESTIIDTTGEIPMVLRPGYITLEMIENVVGKVDVDPTLSSKPTEDFAPKAPGMKYRHYAPKADYSIYRGNIKDVSKKIIQLANEKIAKGQKIGIITADQHVDLYEGQVDSTVKVVSLGDLDRPETIAANLFKALRDFDKEDTEYILGEAFSENNIGFAIMNRLTKAAGYNIIDV